MLWILFVLTGMAQDASKGKIVDADTNEGIPYATIAIVGTADGVVSDHQGYFPLLMTHMFDSVRISAVGYKPITIATADLKDPFTVALEKKHFALDEVVVEPSDACNTVKIGNFGKRRGSSDGFPFPGFEGFQKALLVLPPDTLRTYTVNKAMVFLTGKTNWGVPFRLRIYEYDTSTGLPGRDLTAESIIVTPEEKKLFWREYLEDGLQLIWKNIQ